MDTDQDSLEESQRLVLHPSRHTEDEWDARYSPPVDPLFDLVIILCLRSFDVHCRRWYLETHPRRSPGTHSRISCPPTLHLSVRLKISSRTLLPTLLFSQNMALTSIEVPSVTPPMGPVNPEPTYTDENITVYSIPFFPEVDQDSHPLSSDSHQPSPSKRKRWASSTSPPRRSRDEEFSSETKNVPLKDRMRLNGFLPTDLVGEDAKEWREMIVKNMFPATDLKPRKRGDEDVDVDPPYLSSFRRHSGSFNPAGSDRQLPEMNFTKDSEPITPHQKPSFAYIVVGPKTRGKFDAKKADELGLKGRLRGLVASGTTVTFTITDAHGREIERTVRPVDCVGPGSCPAVCPEIA